MAKQIKTLQDYQQYAAGVFERMHHHAGRVKITSMILAGLVATVADPGSISVRTYSGKTTNVIWFSVNQHGYCLTYDHDDHAIVIHDEIMTGPEIMRINDDDLSWAEDLIDTFTKEAE